MGEAVKRPWWGPQRRLHGRGAGQEPLGQEGRRSEETPPRCGRGTAVSRVVDSGAWPVWQRMAATWAVQGLKLGPRVELEPGCWIGEPPRQPNTGLCLPSTIEVPSCFLTNEVQAAFLWSRRAARAAPLLPITRHALKQALQCFRGRTSHPSLPCPPRALHRLSPSLAPASPPLLP